MENSGKTSINLMYIGLPIGLMYAYSEDSGIAGYIGYSLLFGIVVPTMAILAFGAITGVPVSVGTDK
jgi:hypothetical protein